MNDVISFILLHFDRFFKFESRLPKFGPPTVARDRVAEFEKLFNVCEKNEEEEEETE